MKSQEYMGREIKKFGAIRASNVGLGMTNELGKVKWNQITKSQGG